MILTQRPRRHAKKRTGIATKRHEETRKFEPLMKQPRGFNQKDADKKIGRKEEDKMMGGKMMKKGHVVFVPKILPGMNRREF